MWRDAWVHHPLRTEGNKTPMQLWIGGLHFTHFGQTVMHSASDASNGGILIVAMLKLVLNLYNVVHFNANESVSHSCEKS